MIRLNPLPDINYVSQNFTVLITGLDGFITDKRKHGLFVYQTRVLSHYRYTINGQAWEPNAQANTEQHSWLGYYISAAPGDTLGYKPNEITAQHTVELLLTRMLGKGSPEGMQEEVIITNYTQLAVDFELGLELEADFADQKDLLNNSWPGQEELSESWHYLEPAGSELRFSFRTEHAYTEQGRESVARISGNHTIRVKQSTSVPHYENGRLIFKVHLEPHGSWQAQLVHIPQLESFTLQPPADHAGSSSRLRKEILQLQHDGQSFSEQHQYYNQTATDFAIPGAVDMLFTVYETLQRARQDLADLRLYSLEQDELSWLMAAGLPGYLALFGRDMLTTAWEAALLSPAMMRGVLKELPRWQGQEVNSWRDEFPGRMLHEASPGPLPLLNYIPHRRYYGSITTSAFYPVALSEFWHWTGEFETVGALIKPALAGLEYLDSYCRNQAGFYQYRTYSPLGLKHQAWKDSHDAVVYKDGSQADPPIATCEEQGFVYAAKLQLAEICLWAGEQAEAKRLYNEASELKKRFNDTFWMEEEGTFAFGIDARGDLIRSIVSNPGHCLAAGITDTSLAAQTASRLMAQDMFSGWGIRTLSNEHPAYNPYSYHRGSIWPVEQGTFSVGFYRYGLHDYTARLTQAQFEAAALFNLYRLPEVFSGHTRDSVHPFPAFYPRANWPQAWSASAVFCHIQALLGLYPYAPLSVLFIDPHLPAWLPELTLKNLQVGKSRVTIRFYHNEKNYSDYQLLACEGPLHILRQPSPWSLTATWPERFIDVIKSLLPQEASSAKENHTLKNS